MAARTFNARRVLTGLGGALGLGFGFLLLSGNNVAKASSPQLAPAHHPWGHTGLASTFDTQSVRRGYEVYRNVCATCHSMEYLHFRNLVGVTHNTDQAKALAATFEYEDGPNDKGEMFMRPGRLSDPFKKAYANEVIARIVNNGAYPPDLSLMAKARFNGEDYLFSLLTGYKESPAGIHLRQGLYYNPYFPGGAIAMPPALLDGQVDYEDGTPATVSQLAKDVTTFLCWAAEPEHDRRKKMGMKTLMTFSALFVLTSYWARLKWNIFKTRKFSFTDKRYR